MWGVIGITLTALLVLVLSYPFRIHLEFSKDDREPAPQVGVILLGPYNMSIALPTRHNASGAPGEATAPGGGSKSANSGAKTKTAIGGRLNQLLTVASFVNDTFLSAPATGTDGARKGPLTQFIGPRMDMLSLIRRCERLTWSTRIGTGEAALTALLTGSLWSLKSIAYAVLARKIHFDKTPQFTVHPDWENPTFAVHIDCIFRFRLGEIIFAWIGGIAREWQKGVHRFGHGQRPSH